MTERLRRVLWALRHPIWVYGPRCGATGPWRLPDCGTCIAPRGHERHGRDDADWHADGTGYIWNDDLGRWRWMGEPVNVEDLYDLPPGLEHLAVFTEQATDDHRAQGHHWPRPARHLDTRPIRPQPQEPTP